MKGKMPCFIVCLQKMSSYRKVDFMRKRIEMSRLSLHVPTTLYDRIDTDSKRYGISKTALVQTMIVNLNITVRQSRQSGVARATCPD